MSFADRVSSTVHNPPLSFNPHYCQRQQEPCRHLVSPVEVSCLPSMSELLGQSLNHIAVLLSFLRVCCQPKAKLLVQWSTGFQHFWYCELLEACGYAKGPRMWLFLFNIMWLLSPEDRFVLVSYAPSGGILQGSSLDLCFVSLLSGLPAWSIPYSLSSEGINVFKKLDDAIKQLEFENTETHHTVGCICVRQWGATLAKVTAYKQND